MEISISEYKKVREVHTVYRIFIPLKKLYNHNTTKIMKMLSIIIKKACGSNTYRIAMPIIDKNKVLMHT